MERYSTLIPRHITEAQVKITSDMPQAKAEYTSLLNELERRQDNVMRSRSAFLRIRLRVGVTRMDTFRR